ncbi:hypothetical protein THICB310048 [Thiomonas sp. CB3]|nr:hypothetical protein THICB310048 [Thiomonas sp. CB3]
MDRQPGRQSGARRANSCEANLPDHHAPWGSPQGGNTSGAQNLSDYIHEVCLRSVSRKRWAALSFLDPHGGRAGPSPAQGPLKAPGHADLS